MISSSTEHEKSSNREQKSEIALSSDVLFVHDYKKKKQVTQQVFSLIFFQIISIISSLSAAVVCAVEADGKAAVTGLRVQPSPTEFAKIWKVVSHLRL